MFFVKRSIFQTFFLFNDVCMCVWYQKYKFSSIPNKLRGR